MSSLKQSGGSGMANSSQMVWGKGPQELHPLVSDLHNYSPGFGGYCPFDAPSVHYGSQMTSSNWIICLFVMFFLLRLIGLFGHELWQMHIGCLCKCSFCFPWPISMPELRPLFLSLSQCASWTELMTKRLLSGPKLLLPQCS